MHLLTALKLTCQCGWLIRTAFCDEELAGLQACVHREPCKEGHVLASLALIERALNNLGFFIIS